jgi:hypothetical protein
MGDRPHDPTPDDDPGARPRRPRAVDRGRSGGTPRRPSARTGSSRGPAGTSRAAAGSSPVRAGSGRGAAAGRAAAGSSRAAAGSATRASSSRGTSTARTSPNRGQSGRTQSGRTQSGRGQAVRDQPARTSGGPDRPAGRGGPGPSGGPSTRPRPSPRTEPARPGRRPPSQTTMITILSVATVIVLSLVVYALVLRPSGTTGAGAGAGPTTTVDPDAPGTTLPDSEFDTFTSPTQGFTIRYPKEWRAADYEGGLALDAGGTDAVDVRLLQRTEVPTTVDNLANIKAFTDGVVGLNKSAVILKQQAIMLNGMPGYYYLYTFTEGETGAEGVHAHYFLFRGRNMYTIVFQAIPSDGFGRLSSVFDQIAQSFETQPDTGPVPGVPEGPPTTVAAPAG